MFTLLDNLGPTAGNMMYTFLAGIIGLCIGSFLNVVIYRLPKMMQRECDNYIAQENNQTPPHSDVFNLLSPRSHCPVCNHRISPLENIPLFSYLFLKGQCSACHTHISKRYAIIELLTGILSATLVWFFGITAMGMGALLLTFFLICITFIDIDTQLIPDDLALPLLWIGLLFNVNSTFTTLSSAVIGAVAGYISLWTIFWIFKLVTGKEGIGQGDFKLLAALGAWFGWAMLPVIMLLSSAVGAIIGIGLIVLAKHERDIPIPFGPYLAGAGMIALLYGKTIAPYLFIS